MALYDAPRPDAKKLIDELKSLGIAVKMMTGDALPIAKEVVREVDLGNNVIKASELRDLVKDDLSKAGEIAEKSSLFAIFSIFVMRERGHFWHSKPGKALLIATLLDLAVAFLIGLIGIPGLSPLPLPLMFTILGYSTMFSLVINDFIKYILIRKVLIKW
ncbi:MAG: hypothetical protein QXF82_05515 [Nitrososphaeria archaeon]